MKGKSDQSAETRRGAPDALDALKAAETTPEWRILGLGGLPSPPSGFSDRVLARIETEQTAETRFGRMLRHLSFVLRPPVAATALILFFLIAAFSLRDIYPPETGSTRIVETTADLQPADIDILLDLDLLIAYDETLLWTDASLF